MEVEFKDNKNIDKDIVFDLKQIDPLPNLLFSNAKDRLQRKNNYDRNKAKERLESLTNDNYNKSLFTLK